MKQQDAEECWSQIISAIHAHFKSESRGQSFVDVFMSGQMVSSLTCVTSLNEPMVHRTETFAKLNCYIGITTNFNVHDSVPGHPMCSEFTALR